MTKKKLKLYSWGELAESGSRGRHCSFRPDLPQPNPPSSSLPHYPSPTTTYRESAYILYGESTIWQHLTVINTQTDRGLFSRRLEEEIEEHKQHSPRPGSGFHGVLSHPRDSSHTQHTVQEKHANLKAAKDRAQSTLVNNFGSRLIMNQTQGIVAEV